MKPLKLITLTLAATGILALASGAMAGEFDLRVGSGGVSVAIDLGTPPPAPRIEVIPPPRVGYLWAPGYWAWTGHRHEWVAGRWLEARRLSPLSRPLGATRRAVVLRARTLASVRACRDAARTWAKRGESPQGASRRPLPRSRSRVRPAPKKQKGPQAVRLRALESVGWLMGLEPTTTGITIRDSTN